MCATSVDLNTGAGGVMFLKPLKMSEIAFLHFIILHLWGLEPRIHLIQMQTLLAGNTYSAYKPADQNLSFVLAQGRCARIQSWHCQLKDGDDLFQFDGWWAGFLNAV